MSDERAVKNYIQFCHPEPKGFSQLAFKNLYEFKRRGTISVAFGIALQAWTEKLSDGE
ncbi:MAG: hypothetical protein FWD47_05190 [Treponema sp.]|nr:hypothetical protein [Treponema sp.]